MCPSLPVHCWDTNRGVGNDKPVRAANVNPPLGSPIPSSYSGGSRRLNPVFAAPQVGFSRLLQTPLKALCSVSLQIGTSPSQVARTINSTLPTFHTWFWSDLSCVASSLKSLICEWIRWIFPNNFLFRSSIAAEKGVCDVALKWKYSIENLASLLMMFIAVLIKWSGKITFKCFLWKGLVETAASKVW